MSQPRTRKIDCPQCHVEHDFATWESLNVTLDPAKKEELLSGELTQFACPACAWRGDVFYPLLYHDMERRLMIWFWPGAGEPDTKSLPLQMMKEYQFRIVASRNELKEKVWLFDAGFDDRVVEAFKLTLLERSGAAGHPLEGNIFFVGLFGSDDGTERLRFEHVLKTGSEAVELPLSSYTEMADLIADVLPPDESEQGKWLRVDKEYARALMQKIQP
ncbi:MAG: hypothetical protein JWM68_2978 [Verrucomicrobiales bacterium]|nr:hypothetical protein [Verrucomicrobiales bacterium]